MSDKIITTTYYKCRKSYNIEVPRNKAKSPDYIQRGLVYLLRQINDDIYIFTADFKKIINKQEPNLLKIKIKIDDFEEYFYRNPFKIETHLNVLKNGYKYNKRQKIK